MKRAFAFVAVALLAGCGGNADDKAGAEAVQAAGSTSAKAAGAAVVESGATPVDQRVATIGLLNKRNNLTQDLLLKSGESRRVGNVIVKLSVCERTKPWEKPEEEGAFVQVFVEERASSKEKLAWHKVFSGWLFKNSPSLNVVEHPVYDVWVKSCAMKFPGEEEKPKAPASSRSAAKASGSVSETPAPSPSVAPTEPPAAPAAPE